MNKAFQFFKEVRQETDKVTWPTRRETLITSGAVFVMVILAAIFFLIVDYFLWLGVNATLGLGS
ncbi:preprotein translocase subunit SecE [Zavarzinia sp. CC-PAN008]|uniref:preprotein translocase subunit SecE n=1 Tax=Zavarzinia sp. CC-PAN008 TaxID=3243332 RepID=UPI003F744F84